MHRIKYLSRFSLVALIALMAVAAPMKLKAQDDASDEETIAPPATNTSAPPVIIDESDSGSVPDVEEYDG
ncbi:MAG: hypothetical protein ACXVLQ_08490 [Bacteriovorax sp.]